MAISSSHASGDFCWTGQPFKIMQISEIRSEYSVLKALGLDSTQLSLTSGALTLLQKPPQFNGNFLQKMLELSTGASYYLHMIRDEVTVKQQSNSDRWAIYLNGSVWEDNFLARSSAEDVAYSLRKRLRIL
jgi:hypothetical protein